MHSILSSSDGHWYTHVYLDTVFLRQNYITFMESGYYVSSGYYDYM